MRHWSLLGIRVLRDKPGRAAGAALAIALGVATIVWVTSAYQSVHDALEDQVVAWVGKSQISIEPPHLGTIDESLVPKLRAAGNVATVAPRMKTTALCIPPGRQRGRRAPQVGISAVDIIGIDAHAEYDLRAFRTRDGALTADPHPTHGRLLRPGERQACMIEESLARRYKLEIGDDLALTAEPGGAVTRLKIVGQFMLRRLAKLQLSTVIAPLADVQALKKRPGRVTIIDVMLQDASIPALRATAAELDRIVAQTEQNTIVQTAEARIRQLDTARSQTEFVLMLISAVALLTSFFIVATTMSMSMVERVAQLGMMRCVGVTRRQLTWTTAIEIVPIGVVGVAAGVPIGMALTHFSVSMVPEYIQEIVISRWGLWLAIVGGLITAVASGFIPAVQASLVSPLEATRPQAAVPRVVLAVVAAVIGVSLIAAHHIGILILPARYWFNNVLATGETLALYLGYALLSPLLIYAGSEILSYVAALVLGLRRRLLHKQIASMPWRSGTICTGFMVALSLVVCISIHSESVVAGWDFPTQIPESYVWVPDLVPAAEAEKAGRVEGVRDVIELTNFMCFIHGGQRTGVAISRFPFSTFVGIEVDPFFKLIKMEFLEGSEQTAKAKMKQGGFILVPQECALQLGLSVGDKVSISFGRLAHDFEVAAVVKSPSLDIAAHYFQADRQLMQAAGSSVLGTVDDAAEHFEFDRLSLLLVNHDLPQGSGPVPKPFHAKRTLNKVTHEQMAAYLIEWGDLIPQHQEIVTRLVPQLEEWLAGVETWHQGGRSGRFPRTPLELHAFTTAMGMAKYNWAELTPRQRFERFREQLVLQQIKQAIGRPNAQTGSIRQLKEDIDRDIRKAMLLVTTIPIVGLIIAAIGAGNLMMANVSVRIRQFAMLRAVGMSQWQVVRLVLAEALILGALGTVLGLALGGHAAWSLSELTFKAWGFRPEWTIPWSFVASSVLLTIGICIVAGTVPARYAARSNIIAAMSTT